MPKISRFLAVLVLTVASQALGATPASALPQAQAPTSVAGFWTGVGDDFATSDSVREPILFRGSASVLALVHELEALSSSAAHMLRTLRERGVPVVFGTFEDMEGAVRTAFRTYDPGRTRALGYMAPRVHEHAGTGLIATDEILVGLNLTRLDALFAESRRRPAAAAGGWAYIQRLETLALLGHEIAHAYGLVLSGGDPRLGCADPAEGEDPQTACVVIAENLIRRDLGAPLDWGYGVASPDDLAARYAALSLHRGALREVEAQTAAWSQRMAHDPVFDLASTPAFRFAAARSPDPAASPSPDPAIGPLQPAALGPL